MTGRNDPCPCGSGKKFKKCHGVSAISIAPEDSAVARATSLKRIDVELGDRLMRFARSRFGPDWLPRAAAVYMDFQDDDIPQPELPLALPWILYSLETEPDGLTLAEHWRRERPKDVTPDIRVVLDAYAASWLSVWEITRVERGVGTQLVDLLTRQERFVYDVASSQSLNRFDSLLAFVIDCGDVSFFGGVHSQPLPPRGADVVVRQGRRIGRVRTRPVAIDILRGNPAQLDLIAAWNYQVDSMLMQPPPILTNTDGDLIAMTTDDFELPAPPADVLRRLESLPGAGPPEEEDGDDVSITITKPGNAQHRTWDNTVIGRIVVSAKRMRIETNSTRRADSVRTAVETHLAGLVRFRLRSEADMATMMEEMAAAKRQGAAADPEPPAAELLAAARAFRERHMAAWVDESIPALDGLTPRDAARSPRTRPALELLLKEMEHRDQRLRAEERVDLDRIRAELGLATTKS